MSEGTLMKLVRDGIEERPGLALSRCVDDMVYRTMLLAKLVEEAKELMMATSRQNFIEELADIAEVVEAIMDHAGISTVELRSVKEVKRSVKGSFAQRKLAVIGKVDV